MTGTIKTPQQALGAVTVTSQAELDKAIADKASTVYVESPDGVWLYLNSDLPSHQPPHTPETSR